MKLLTKPTYTAVLVVAMAAMVGSQPVWGQGRRGGGFTGPSVSVRSADQGRFTATAVNLLGWRLGVRTDAFGSLSFSEGAAKADAAGLAFVEGVSTQKVSPEIPKNLDYHLTAAEVEAVKARLNELRLRMAAYRVETIPSDEMSSRKLFEFAKELGADVIIGPAEPAALAALDKLAQEFEMNVAAVIRDPKSVALAGMEARSERVGLSADIGTWMEQGMQPLKLASNRLLAVNLRDRSDMGTKARNVKLGSGAAKATEFLVQLSRLQPPKTPGWPPECTDCGWERAPTKPLFFTVEPTGAADIVADLAASAEAYDQAMRHAGGWRIAELSRKTPISSPDLATAEDRAKIDAAVPRQALVKPKQPRKLLVMDLCVNGAFYHRSIPHANLALELMGKYTGAFTPVFSNDVDNLKYPKIKEFDAVFLNSVIGDVFLEPDVMNGLSRYVREGGGVAGLHAATWASQNVLEYGELMGARSGPHKYNGEPGTVKIDDPNSPITKHLGGKGFEFFDEYYHFPDNAPYSRENLHVLLSIDVAKTDISRYEEVRRDKDFGLVWIRSYGKGRVFHCAMAHRPEFLETPDLSKMILAGIQFALGDLEADTTPSAKLAARK